MEKEYKSIFSGRKVTTEYICTYCGRRVPRSSTAGRPSPGSCPKRKTMSGSCMPHRWVINRKY